MSKSIHYVWALGRELWTDTRGFIISAELVILTSLLVVGLIVGLTALQQSVNAEMNDVAGAIGSLNQSYFYQGMHAYKDCGCYLKSATAGSCFRDLKDECDADQCEINGDHFHCVNTPVATVNNVYVKDEHVTTDILVPRTPDTAVIQKEEKTDVPIAPVPETTNVIVPIPESQTNVVVPPLPQAGCTDCVQPNVQPLATCCGQHSRCGCGKAFGYGCQNGCGHAYGWGGIQSEFPYPVAPMGSRPAPNAWGGVEQSGGFGGYGGGYYQGGYGGPSQFQSLDRTGYYRILNPN
jgi:hypothetical protein